MKRENALIPQLTPPALTIPRLASTLPSLPLAAQLSLPLSVDAFPSCNLGTSSATVAWTSTFPSHPILPLITNGIRITLIDPPVLPVHVANFRLPPEDAAIVDAELAALLSLGRIEPCPLPAWIHPPFVVTQPSGKKRVCFDMSYMSKHTRNSSFKMEGLKEARALLHPGAWLCKLDLKDAYHSIPVDPTCRKYLAFPFRDRIYQWKVLPFGLSSAPRLFSKILSTALSPLRQNGMKYIQYLDDILLIADDAATAQAHINLLAGWLVHLGFQLGLKKSIQIPVRRIDFLGFTLDAPTMQISVPSEKLHTLTRGMNMLATGVPTTARRLAAVLGLLSSLSPAVLPAHIHQRWLQASLKLHLSNGQSWENKCILSNLAMGEVHWWLTHLFQWTWRPIREPPSTFHLRIQTDASASGWGVVTPLYTFHGRWSLLESQRSSNWREASAVLHAMRRLAPLHKNQDILLESDNTTVVALLRRGGTTSSASLLHVAKEIWHLLLQNRVRIHATYLPGVENVAADRASRRAEMDHMDYGISWRGWAHVCSWLGYTPSIDLFATQRSARCARFFSWAPEPLSVGVDAFCHEWPIQNGYAYPPPALILRVVQEALERRLKRLVLVTPNWSSAPWWPLMTALSQRAPLHLEASNLERLPAPPHPPTTKGALVWLLYPCLRH